jgi:hypothetical protein
MPFYFSLHLPEISDQFAKPDRPTRPQNHSRIILFNTNNQRSPDFNPSSIEDVPGYIPSSSPFMMNEEDLSPRYSLEAYYIESLEINLYVGTYVRMSDQRIVRLIKKLGLMIDDNGDSSSSFEAQICPLFAKGAPDHDSSNPLLVGLMEVYLSQETVVVTNSQISDLVFVFDDDTVISHAIAAHGMRNFYICRVSRASNGSFCGLKKAQICSFASFSPIFPRHLSCHASDIWSDLLRCQESFRKCLSDQSRNAMDHWYQEDKIRLGSTSWFYFVKSLRSTAPNLRSVQKTTRVYKQAMAIGLKTVGASVLLPSEELSLETGEDLSALAEVFGSCVLFGVPAAPPKVGTVRSLRENSDIHVLVPTTEVPGYCCVRMKHDGINLWLTAQYHRYRFRTNSAGQPVDCISPALLSAINFGRHDKMC